MEPTQTKETENQRWSHVIFLLQLVMAVCVFITEVINNIVLYITRSQGYGPDTIVLKLFRYLFITSVINFGATFFSQFFIRRSGNLNTTKKVLMITTLIICTNISLSHYQFASTLCVFVLPIVFSILFEDARLSTHTFHLSLIGLSIAVIVRASDPLYKQDIIPEASICCMLLVSVYLFSKIVRQTLSQRTSELADAIVTQERIRSAEAQQQLSLKMLETLARTIDAKDKYTNGHSERVSTYSVLLAEALGFEEKEITQLRYEALLHDIGKIGVPDSILNKPEKLTEIEFKIIQSHTVIGADIIKDMAILPNAFAVARHHHEKFNGTGYPNGLSGMDIPVHARIVCITDAYDAMNSDRIYRKALSEKTIRNELLKGRGTQFDPNFLDAFLRLFDAGKLPNVQLSPVLEENPSLEDLMNSISDVIYRISTQKSLTDFGNFYLYMRNIGLRYNRSIEVVSLRLTPLETVTLSAAELEEAHEAFRVAIRKNIRAVDIYFEYTPNQHLIIFLDAGTDHIDVIVERIYFDLSQQIDVANYHFSHELNNDIV